MSASQGTMKDPEDVDMDDKGGKGKAKKKFDEVTPARKKMEDPRIKVVEKEGVETFKCDEYGNDFKTMTGAKHHMAKKHRARSEDGDEDEEAKRAKTDDNKDTTSNDALLLGIEDKEAEDLTVSQVSRLEEMLSKYDDIKVVSVEEDGDSLETKEVDDEKVEEGKLASAIERIQEIEEELNETKASLEVLKDWWKQRIL